MENLKAGFWLRVTALTIDEILLVSFVLMVVKLLKTFTVLSLSHSVLFILLFYELFDYNYYTLFWLLGGQTPGKMIMRTKLVKIDGTAISYKDVFIRYWAWMLGAAFLGVGYFWIAFNKKKQGWNDLAAGTYVVKI